MNNTMENPKVTIVVGDYSFISHLGSGCFGDVYKGSHVHEKHDVVVKKLDPNIALGGYSEETHDKLNQEIQSVQQFNHKNIVKLLDSYYQSGKIYIVMEYCDMEHLGTYLSSNATLSFPDRVKLMQQGVSAMGYMHSRKPPLIHRAIKPQNVLIKKDKDEDVLKISDCFISKLHENRLLRTDSIPKRLQNPYFAAPEFYSQIDTDYSQSTDAFALGLLFKLILEFCEENKSLLPLSTSAKKSGKQIPFGREMVDCFRHKVPLPILAEIASRDNLVTKRLKEIINHMTCYKQTERKRIHEVEAEISDVLSIVTSKENGDHKPDNDQTSIPQLRNLTKTAVNMIFVELLAKLEKCEKEKEDLVSQFKIQKDLLSQLEKEKERLVSQFDKEKEDIMSQFEKEKEDLMLQFKSEKETFVSHLNQLRIIEEENEKLKLALKQKKPYEEKLVPAISASDLKDVSKILNKKKNWPEEIDGYCIKKNMLVFDILSDSKEKCRNFLETVWDEISENYGVTIDQCVIFQEEDQLSQFAVGGGDAIFNISDVDKCKRILKNTNIRSVACINTHEKADVTYGTVGCVAEGTVGEEYKQLYVITAQHVFRNGQELKLGKDEKVGHYLSCDRVTATESEASGIKQVSNKTFGVLGYDEKAVDIALLNVEKSSEVDVGTFLDSVPKVFDGASTELDGKEVEMLGARSKANIGVVFCTDYIVQYLGEMFEDALLVIGKGKDAEHFAQKGDSGALVLWNQGGGSKVAIGLVSKMEKLERTLGNKKSTVVVRLDNCFKAIQKQYGDVSDLKLCGYWNGVEIKPFLDL